MSEVRKFHKKPIVVEAIHWEGGDCKHLMLFCGRNWGLADANNIPWSDDDKEKVVIWNSMESQWLKVPVGHWIIRGIKGEFYPCDPIVFAETYKPIDDHSEAT